MNNNLQQNEKQIRKELLRIEAKDPIAIEIEDNTLDGQWSEIKWAQV